MYTMSEGPLGRPYEGIPPHALSDYESIRRSQLERRVFDFADIRRIMAAIYADTLCRRKNTLAVISVVY